MGSVLVGGLGIGIGIGIIGKGLFYYFGAFLSKKVREESIQTDECSTGAETLPIKSTSNLVITNHGLAARMLRSRREDFSIQTDKELVNKDIQTVAEPAI